MNTQNVFISMNIGALCRLKFKCFISMNIGALCRLKFKC